MRIRHRRHLHRLRSGGGTDQFSCVHLVHRCMTGFIYPIAGHWVWSAGGWLGGLGMIDFAGSATIHALGGFAALAAAILIGPRIGKFSESGAANIVPPSNLPLASVGAFILWFGWFGFNSGSTLSATNGSIGHIAVTTMLAAASGGATCILFTMIRYRKADPPMVINGSLAGLVGITAGCAFVSDLAAILIGAVCGIAWYSQPNFLNRDGSTIRSARSRFTALAAAWERSPSDSSPSLN